MVMVMSLQADLTHASEIPGGLLIPSSTVPNSTVRFLLFLTILRLGPQVPFDQVLASHTCKPSIRPTIHS